MDLHILTTLMLASAVATTLWFGYRIFEETDL